MSGKPTSFFYRTYNFKKDKPKSIVKSPYNQEFYEVLLFNPPLFLLLLNY